MRRVGHEEAEAGGTQSWAALVGVVASVTVFALGQGLTYPLLSLILERQGQPASLIGLSAAMTPLGLIVSAPLIPTFADRFGARRVALSSALLGAVVLAAIGLTRDAVLWFPLRFLLGAVMIQLYVLSETWVIALAPARTRGRVMGAYASTLAGGFAAGPLILLAVGSDTFAPFLVGIAAFGLCALALAAVRRRLPVFAPGERGAVRRFLPLAPVLLLSIAAVGAFEQAMLSLMPIYAFEHGRGEAEAAALLAVMIAGGIAMPTPLGMACERIAPRRVLIACVATTALGAALLPLAIGNLGAWPLIFLWGAAAYGIYTVALVELGARFSGAMLIAGNAAFALMWGIGGLAGPPGTGVAIDVLGRAGLPLAVGGLFVALLAFIAVRGRLARRRGLQPET